MIVNSKKKQSSAQIFRDFVLRKILT